MIKTLRKRHLQIWTAWAILLPAGITAGYVAVPRNYTSASLGTSTGRALPVVVKTVDKKNYTVAVRTNSASSAWQLEWKNKKAPGYPSSLVYALPAGTNDAANGILTGRVEAAGTFYFPLTKDIAMQYHYVLYDIIHHQIIDTINFNK